LLKIGIERVLVLNLLVGESFLNLFVHFVFSLEQFLQVLFHIVSFNNKDIISIEFSRFKLIANMKKASEYFSNKQQKP
jgi:hypothetical protein